MRHFGSVASVCMVVVLAPASGARAGTVNFGSALPTNTTSVSFFDFSENDPIPEANVVTVGYDALLDEIVIIDLGAPITIGNGCRSVLPTEARCPRPQSSVQIKPGPGDDRVTLLDGLPELTGVGAFKPYNVDGFVRESGGDGTDVFTGSGRNEYFNGGTSGADEIDAGDGQDLVYGRSPASTLRGGPGSDELQNALPSTAGSAGAAVMEGGTGSDSLFGRGRLDGGADGDQLFPTPTTGDLIDGGTGDDTVSFADHPAPVTVDLAGGPAFDQGSSDERDRIFGVEDAIGSPNGGDVVSGDDGPNVLTSLDGADELHGRGGDDELHAGGGVDLLDGGAGVFDLASFTHRPGGVVADLSNTSSTSADRFLGIEAIRDSLADDVITGTSSTDSVRVTSGRDRIDVRDGTMDFVDCLPESGTDDVVIADRIDAVQNCSGVDRPPPPDGDADGVPDSADLCPTAVGPASEFGCPPPVAQPPLAHRPFTARPATTLPGPSGSMSARLPRVLATKLRADRRRQIRVKLASGTPQTVRVLLVRNGRTIASGSARAQAERPTTVTLKLSNAAFRAAKRRPISAKLTLSAPSGRRSQTVTIRR